MNPPPDRPAGLICDLDGVVYRGQQACPGAREALLDARAAGLRVLFLTNNAARTAQQVAEHLLALGVEATVEEVLTSSQVAAQAVIDLGLVGADEVVLAVGGPGVRKALHESGLGVVTPREAEGSTRAMTVVVQGYGPEVSVGDLSEACYALNSGATWVATNADSTIPTARGVGPGNGALLAAVALATGRRPDHVVGKPEPAAYATALQRLGLRAAQVLAVGDRLDTDIDGAARLGIPTALVLTGVHREADVEATPPDRRPDHVVELMTDLIPLWQAER